MKSALKFHAEILKQLAAALAQSASEHLKDWTEVYFEVGQCEGESSVDRTIARSATTRMDIHPNSDVNECMASLVDVRTELPGEPWMCLSMLVNRDGEVDVKYSYDPNWVNRFFDDFENHRPF